MVNLGGGRPLPGNGITVYPASSPNTVGIGVNNGGDAGDAFPPEITVRGTPMLFVPPPDFDHLRRENGKI